MKKQATHSVWSPKNWSLSAKITSVFILMTIFLITVIIIISSSNVKKTMSKQTGLQFEITAGSINQTISEYLMIFINQMGTLSTNEGLQSFITEHNKSYNDTNRSKRLGEIMDIDHKWIEANGEIPLLKEIITSDYNKNRAANIIQRFVKRFPLHNEITISDKYGALLAATQKTSDYYQGDEEWWIKAWNNGSGGFFIGTPEFNERLKQIILQIAFPIYSDENKPIAIIRTSIQADNIISFIENTQNEKSSIKQVLSKEGRRIFREQTRVGYENLAFSNNNTDVGHGISYNSNGEELLYGFKKLDVKHIQNIQENIKQHFFDAVDNLNWYIVYSQKTSDAFKAINIVRNSIVITSLILLIVFIIINILIIKKLLLPLKNILDIGGNIIEGDFSETVEVRSNDETGKLSLMFNKLILSLREKAEQSIKISEGDLTVEVSTLSEKDEMGNAFKLMVQSLKQKAKQAREIADGNLTIEVEVLSDKDEMGISFQTMVQNLKEQINNISEVVSTLTSSNSQLTSMISQLSASSSETATTVNEISTTIEEVKQTAEVSTQKAKNVSDTALKSVKISENGIKATEDSLEGMVHIQEQVKQIADTIIKLSEQSQTIGEITESVNDLAEQSNLLAVNASIEAVKAGEYGKGFGVVAQEIRALADQSKQSTKQIKEILTDVQKAISSAVMATEQGGKAVDQGMELSESAGDSISMLADSISEASQASTQIAASSRQQLTGMEQLASAMDNIKLAASQNSIGTKQAEETVNSIKTIVDNLKVLIDKYKLN